MRQLIEVRDHGGYNVIGRVFATDDTIPTTRLLSLHKKAGLFGSNRGKVARYFDKYSREYFISGVHGGLVYLRRTHS
jgi:hypothetical protein